MHMCVSCENFTSAYWVYTSQLFPSFTVTIINLYPYPVSISSTQQAFTAGLMQVCAGSGPVTSALRPAPPAARIPCLLSLKAPKAHLLQGLSIAAPSTEMLFHFLHD